MRAVYITIHDMAQGAANGGTQCSVRNYTLLVHNLNAILAAYIEQGGDALSNGNFINARYYASKQECVGESFSVSLPDGVYKATAQVQFKDSFVSYYGNMVLPVGMGSETIEIPYESGGNFEYDFVFTVEPESTSKHFEVATNLNTEVDQFNVFIRHVAPYEPPE